MKDRCSWRTWVGLVVIYSVIGLIVYHKINLVINRKEKESEWVACKEKEV
jgi:hypothetical protein